MKQLILRIYKINNNHY